MGGGRRRSSSSSKPAPDNSMQIWAAEMDKQRQMQQKQYDDMIKQYEKQKADEDARIAADNAKREQALWDEKQMAKDADALQKYKTETETFAQQAGGAPEDSTIADSTTSAMNKKIGDQSKSSLPAPGLTPFGTAIVKPANMIYQTSGARMGGL
jgi:hypothetical protein